jgi:RNA polymerase sigma-B factor
MANDEESFRYVNGKDMWDNAEFDKALKQYRQTGDSLLRDRLILAHIGLVKKIADKYHNRGRDMDVLIQEGEIGLIDCIDNHYDPDREGRNFKAYAISYIRRQIQQALHEDKDVPLEWNRESKLRRMLSFSDDYEKSFGRKPTIEQMAKSTRLSVDLIKELLSYHSNANFVSYDLKSSEGEYIPEFFAVDKKSIEHKETKEKIDSAADMAQDAINKANLTYGERELLYERFGLNGSSHRMTYKELGIKYGFTGETMRGRLQKIRRKIRIANGLIPPKEKSAKS